MSTADRQPTAPGEPAPSAGGSGGLAPAARTGQAPPRLNRAEFGERFREAHADAGYRQDAAAFARFEQVAWSAFDGSHKTRGRRPAGPGFADPDYELSDEWRATRDRLLVAQSRQADAATPSRVLAIVGSPRNDGTCPGESSKSHRLVQLAAEALRADAIDVDVLDLSLVTSEYGRHIHPCKGCASTAMPLCHWPCSCYPNHGLGQGNDWMAEIYERWVAAHGVLIVTPVHWYGAPGVLKLMIDRLVCADGGNPDPTLTCGKDARKAKQVELDGWHYPQHLAGRAYGLLVHGDVAGIEGLRRSLSDWLDWMGLIDAGPRARLDRYIDYYGPYATSHQALDADQALQQEVRLIASALAHQVAELRAGRLARPTALERRPRPK